MARLNEKDRELTLTGKSVDLSAPINAYLGGEFLTNPKDYIEVLIYDTNENFLESNIVSEEDYVFDPQTGVKLKTGTILRKMGYDRGKFIVKYNFLRQVAGSYENVALDENNNITDYVDGETRLKEYKYFIHEVSPTRNEIRIAPQNINDEQYLRDFLYAQKTKKMVQADGTGDSGVTFLGEANGEPPQDESLKIKLNGGEFVPEMVGGTFVIPNAFITKFTEIFAPPAAGGDVVPLETEGDMQARFFLDRDASFEERENSNGVFGDEYFNVAFERFKNNGEGFDDNELPDNTNGLKFTGAERMENIRDLVDSVFKTVWFVRDGDDGANVVIRSNSTLASGDAPTTYTWQITGFDRDAGDVFDRVVPRPDGATEGGDFRIVNQVTGEDNLATTFGANQFQARTEDSTDGSTLVFRAFSTNLHIGIKLTINQAFGEGSSATSTIHLPCILEFH